MYEAAARFAPPCDDRFSAGEFPGGGTTGRAIARLPAAAWSGEGRPQLHVRGPGHRRLPGSGRHPPAEYPQPHGGLRTGLLVLLEGGAFLTPAGFGCSVVRGFGLAPIWAEACGRFTLNPR